jgi:hypothetical protein
MKKLLILSGLAILLNACSSEQNNSAAESSSTENAGQFGAKIDEAGAIPVSELMAQMNGKEKMSAKVEGKIAECCQRKGCWMNIDKGDGTTMKVTFTDYGFFVPKDAAGKTAIMQGRAYIDTLSVETLRHYAEDAGKSQEEIDKITEPEIELAFEADGVIIK